MFSQDSPAMNLVTRSLPRGSERSLGSEETRQQLQVSILLGSSGCFSVANVQRVLTECREKDAQDAPWYTIPTFGLNFG